MELDFSRCRWPILALAAILLLAALGWIGYAYTPQGDKPLTWSEWQILKARRAYQQELERLQQAAGTLADLLETGPDPVRAQLVAENVQRLTGEGQASLAYQREKLALAAQAVSDWAVGASDQDSAQAALRDALGALSPEPELQTAPPAESSGSLIFLPIAVKGFQR